MSAIIWRNIKGRIHFLNCKNGQIVSLEIDSKEARAILANPDSYRLDSETKNVFKKIGGQYNSKLCRKNLIKLGLAFNFPTTVNIELS